MNAKNSISSLNKMHCFTVCYMVIYISDYKVTFCVSNQIWLGVNTKYVFEHLWLSSLSHLNPHQTDIPRIGQCLTSLGKQVFPLPFIQRTYTNIATSLKKPGLGPTPPDARRWTLPLNNRSECCAPNQVHRGLTFQFPSRLNYLRHN